MTTYRVDTDSVILAESFRAAEEKVAEERGPFSLFGLFETEDAPNSWDLVAAAPWLYASSNRIKYLIDSVSTYFSVKDWKRISAACPMRTDSDFAKAITRKYHIEHEVEEIGNTYVNGVYISHAFLITSNPSPARAAIETVAA